MVPENPPTFTWLGLEKMRIRSADAYAQLRRNSEK
jgi:hypothetical protein